MLQQRPVRVIGVGGHRQIGTRAKWQWLQWSASMSAAASKSFGQDRRCPTAPRRTQKSTRRHKRSRTSRSEFPRARRRCPGHRPSCPVMLFDTTPPPQKERKKTFRGRNSQKISPPAGPALSATGRRRQRPRPLGWVNKSTRFFGYPSRRRKPDGSTPLQLRK